MSDPTRDMPNTPFDDRPAEAAFGGAEVTDDMPSSTAAIAAVSRAARQPGSAEELANEDAMVDQIVGLVRSGEGASSSVDAQKWPAMRKLAFAKVIPIAAAAVIVTGAAAAAATGALPGFGGGGSSGHPVTLGSHAHSFGSLTATSGSGTTGSTGGTGSTGSTGGSGGTGNTGGTTTTVGGTGNTGGTTTTVGGTGTTGSTGGTGNTGGTTTTTAGGTGNTGNPLTVNPGGPYSGTEGGSLPIAGTVVDTGGTPTTTWTVAPAGSTTGECSVGAPSALSTTLTCTEEGSYTLTLAATDGVNNASRATLVSIADAPLSATGDSFNSTNPVIGTVATFTDGDPGGVLSDYAATIDWGDGTPSSNGTVAQGAASGTFAVTGGHSYADLGPYVVTTRICDTGGACTTATSDVLVFGYASGGAFVIGDASAGSPTVGAAVDFWGAQWAKDNRLSGGPAPSSFKGFENSSATPSACGFSWTSGRGNSVHPPASIPTYMAVIVASSVTKSGKRISGDGVHVVIVKTGAGYGPDPGAAGSGTIVAVLC
jgi:hypothetical protein